MPPRLAKLDFLLKGLLLGPLFCILDALGSCRSARDAYRHLGDAVPHSNGVIIDSATDDVFLGGLGLLGQLTAGVHAWTLG